MNTSVKAVLMAGMSFVATWLCCSSGAWSQEAPNPAPAPDQGIQVLTHGPVHEAYAEPELGRPQPGPIVPRQPPAPVDEMPPDQKPEGNNVQWIPGYWQWDDETADFLWVSGFWRDVPPDKQWVPGFWNQVQGGWQWVPGYWADTQQQEVTYLPPPPPSIDEGPSVPAPSADSIYVPGVWVYNDSRFMWRPGYFMAYNPNWVFIPAHYVWCPAGYVFIDGYWDYPLENRGLLFAPVVLAPSLLSRPGWYFTPQYCVEPSALITALFVRPAYHHYYFGDYFAQGYERRGFVPWVDYRINKRLPDPLFTHLSYRYRNNERWLRDLRTQYAERLAGKLPRPARTLTQPGQGKVGPRIVAPLRDVNRSLVKLQPVPQAQRLKEHEFLRQMATARQARHQAEARVLSQGGALTRPNDRPRTVKLGLPQTTRPAVKTPAHAAPPPRPKAPQHVARPVPQHEPPSPIRAQPKPAPRVEERPPTEARPPNRPATARPVPNEPKTEPREIPRPKAPPSPEARPPVRPAEPRPAPPPAARPPAAAPPHEIKPAPAAPPREVRPPAAQPPHEVKPAPAAPPPAARPPAAAPPRVVKPAPVPPPHEVKPPPPAPPPAARPPAAAPPHEVRPAAPERPPARPAPPVRERNERPPGK